MAETQYNRTETNEEMEIDLIEIWNILRKHMRQIILLCVVAVFVTGVVTFFFIPKKYQSSITFYLQEKSPSGMMAALSSQLGSLSGLIPTGMLGGGANSDLCSEIVLAPSFLRKVLKSENLPYTWLDVEKFTKEVEVEKKKSGALQIRVLWTDPKMAYRLAKRIFADYKQFVDEQINNSNSDNRRFIQDQYGKAQRRLDKAEAALAKYQAAKGQLILPETAAKAIEFYADVEKQKMETTIGLNDARQRLNKAATILDKKAPQVKANVNEALNPLLDAYKTKLAELNVSLAQARENLTDQHPAVKELVRQKEELEQQIKAENVTLNAPDVAGEYMKGMVEVAGLEARQRSLDKVYNTIKGQMGQMPDEMLGYGQLVREQKVAEQVYITLTAQLEQAKFSEDKEDNVEIQVIDPPIVPYRKHSPSTVMNMAIAGLISIFSGMGVILAKENMIKNKTGD